MWRDITVLIQIVKIFRDKTWQIKGILAYKETHHTLNFKDGALK